MRGNETISLFNENYKFFGFNEVSAFFYVIHWNIFFFFFNVKDYEIFMVLENRERTQGKI